MKNSAESAETQDDYGYSAFLKTILNKLTNREHLSSYIT